jgi:hypothetical protein
MDLGQLRSVVMWPRKLKKPSVLGCPIVLRGTLNFPSYL